MKFLRLYRTISDIISKVRNKMTVKSEKDGRSRGTGKQRRKRRIGDETIKAEVMTNIWICTL